VFGQLIALKDIQCGSMVSAVPVCPADIMGETDCVGLWIVHAVGVCTVIICISYHDTLGGFLHPLGIDLLFYLNVSNVAKFNFKKLIV